MHEQYALSEADITFLQAFLDSDDNENGLDFVGTHGFLTAITIGPEWKAGGHWQDALFDNLPVSPDDALAARISGLLAAWQKSIHARLYHGETVTPPCKLHAEPDDSTPLTDWCIGFMEAMFAQEEDWYARDEDQVADLTLPMLVISELIDDEQIVAVRNDKKLLKELAQQIPDVATELYLLFHAPDSPAGKK